MNKQDFKDFMDVLSNFDRAMLVTLRDGQLRSRPMAIGDVTSDSRLRFVTRDDSAKLDELTERPQVNVTCQGDLRFLSISGDARLSKDAQLIDDTWQSKQSPWFVDDKDDPHVIVIEVIPTYAEYWDRSETGLFSRIFGVLPDDAEKHGELDFTREPL